jgi:hypothetical protein
MLIVVYLDIQIDYFNKRRVLEERQRMMYEQGKAPPGAGPAAGNK